MPRSRKYPRSTKSYSFALTKRRGTFLSTEQKKAVKRIVNAGKEKNYQDVASAGFAVSTTATVTKLTGLGQGDGQGERLGDTVSGTSCSFNYHLSRDGGATAKTLFNGRIMLIRWNVDDTDTSPVIGDILESTSQTLSAFVGDQADRKKFDVLLDNHHTLTVRDDSKCTIQSVHNNISLNGKKIYFDASATTGKGHIYLVTLGNQASGVEDATMQYYFRFRYTSD